jgi:hypothetical protein
MDFSAYEPMTFRVRLLKAKCLINKTFPKHSIQPVVATTSGTLYIEGYPAVTLVDNDWEPLFDREDLVRDVPGKRDNV